MMLRAHAMRAPFDRALGALEIGGCGVATSSCGFVLGLHNTGILIGIYAATVIAAYAMVACLERVPPKAQPGND